MVKLINRNGSVMYVHESRVDEYIKAGFKPEQPKLEIKEPIPMVIEAPKAELKEEPKRGLAKPKAKTAAKKPAEKSSAKKRG